MESIKKEKLAVHSDERGKLVEIFKFPGCGQINYIETLPGFVRGNHYHERKREMFCVLEGEAMLKLRNRSDNETKEYALSSDVFEMIEVLPNWVHNVFAVGGKPAKILIWNNEIFNPKDADTHLEEI